MNTRSRDLKTLQYGSLGATSRSQKAQRAKRNNTFRNTSFKETPENHKKIKRTKNTKDFSTFGYTGLKPTLEKQEHTHKGRNNNLRLLDWSHGFWKSTEMFPLFVSKWGEVVALSLRILVVFVFLLFPPNLCVGFLLLALHPPSSVASVVSPLTLIPLERALAVALLVAGRRVCADGRHVFAAPPSGSRRFPQVPGACCYCDLQSTCAARWGWRCYWRL